MEKVDHMYFHGRRGVFKLQEGGDAEHEKGGCLSVYLRMMLLFFLVNAYMSQTA